MRATERFLGAHSERSRDAFRQVVTQMKIAEESGQFAALEASLRLCLVPTIDFTSAQTLYRFYKRLPQGSNSKIPLKVAILGGFTTHQLRDLIDLHLSASGIAAQLYESDYGIFRQEIFDPNSPLHEFSPDVIYLATHWRNLAHVPALTASADEVRNALDAEYHDWAALWQTAHERFNCQVVQNNFDRPSWSALGNHEVSHPASLSSYIRQVNECFAERAPPFVTIHDVDTLASNAGRSAWANERFYLHAKIPCAPEHLVDYARSVSSVISAQRGLSKKCLVLDLDNTLWGGVIGDDGLEGIRVGQGDAEGEAFAFFQRYVKGLAARGVILAVCSKNTDQIAREAFEKHPEMILGLDDISCFVANWNDKAENIRLVANSLNIGLDSLVFIDDNPAERSVIRQLLPEVSVPEVSGDPIDFVEALERHRYFQVTSLGAEDFKRTQFYRANAQRNAVASSTDGIEAFLKSLEMTSSIGPVNDLTLERATQLINKSNQFNLTTRRKTLAEVSAAANSHEWLTVTATLVDRFGDNGLIAVILAAVQGDSLYIDTWLMSCRVLKRGVERFMLNYLVENAGARGLKNIRGEYIPTPKNGLVKNHYAELGFQHLDTRENGRTFWNLCVADFQPLHNYIERV